MKAVIYVSNTTNNNKNCFYPNKVIIGDEQSACLAFSHDYVCAKYKDIIEVKRILYHHPYYLLILIMIIVKMKKNGLLHLRLLSSLLVFLLSFITLRII